MPSIKEKILENWVLKITAIFLALILWLFIRGEPGTVTTVAATVNWELPVGMEISSDFPPATVQVMIRGTSQSLRCNIDLRNAEEGENTVTLNEDQIEATQGRRPEVIQVNPPQIVIMLEKTIQKTVPITVPVQDEVADGFEIYDKISIQFKREKSGREF
jgi:YbbR domain-containing protein